MDEPNIIQLTDGTLAQLITLDGLPHYKPIHLANAETLSDTLRGVQFEILEAQPLPIGAHYKTLGAGEFWQQITRKATHDVG